MLLRDATAVCLDPPAADLVSLRIEGGHIVERGTRLAARAGEETLDLAGALVLPGLVDAHTHLYSALARGMPPPARAPRSFVEILEQVWWRLDRALDEDAIRISALVGAIEAARSGTTTLFDHHASPSCIAGSLSVLRRGVEEVGLRSVLCYETTDRNGLLGRDAGVEENRRFLAEGPTALTRAMVGAHASFTLSDESLTRMSGVVAASGSSLHIHAAEALHDVEDSRARGAAGVVARLCAHGCLGPHALLAHGVHLTPSEIAAAEDAGARLVHCPRSNMNNGVGHAPVTAFGRAALGTDGIDADMLAELKAAFFRLRDDGTPDAAPRALAMLAGGQRLASTCFDMRLGVLEPGAAADLVVCDYRPPTPLTAANLAGHLLFGLDRSHVRSTMVAGCFVLRDRVVATVDEAASLARARTAAPTVWDRMARL